MHRSERFGIVLVFTLAASAACDETLDATPAPADAGSAVDGTADGAAPPTPSPYGLDVRPANTTCRAPARPPPPSGVVFENAFPAAITFAAPMKIRQAPGEPGNLYVAERGSSTTVPAKVKRVPLSAQTPSDVKDFALVPVNPAGEGGLLGMAFHPKWATNRTAFFSYTRTYAAGTDGAPPDSNAGGPINSGLTSIVSRWTSADGGLTVGSPVEVFRRVQPYSNHNGGDIDFGPDGYLYFGLGDGGSGNDPLGSGQRLNTVLGKILRFDVDGAPPYTIPPTNPYASSAGPEKKEIYASGFRNPFRWNFDRETGDLWVGDVGQSAWEEIDKVKLGGNYGWSTCEGFHKRGSTTALCATPGLNDPVVAHGRSEATVITGGIVYRGKAIPSLTGTYVYADYGTGNVWGIVYDGAGRATSKPLGRVPNPVDFTVDADGELYIASLTTGRILKMKPDAAMTTPPSAFPDALSKTGCVDASDPKKPASGLVPYGVRSPLWSDGAEKERFFALPEGGTITVGADGDFDFPRGTVLVKTFRAFGKLLETRLFVRHDDGEWAGYSYEWNDAGTDAQLLPAGKTRALAGGESWTYPSRAQCVQCHTTAAGGSLGLELGQLNGDFVYTSTNRISNQLATLEHIGVLAAPLGDPAKLARYPEPSGTEPLESRALSYLHSNCSHCHRPTGGGGGAMDFRYGQGLVATKACGANPVGGNFGVAAAKVLAPGNPNESMISIRMRAEDAKRMPPIGVRIPDAKGASLIDEWITSVKSCP